MLTIQITPYKKEKEKTPLGCKQCFFLMANFHILATNKMKWDLFLANSLCFREKNPIFLKNYFFHHDNLIVFALLYSLLPIFHSFPFFPNNETLPIVNKSKHPKKAEYNLQSGKTHAQEDKRTTKEGKPLGKH